MQRDSTDMAAFLEGVSQDMRPFYAHMQASKRSTAPTSEQVGSTDEIQALVLAQKQSQEQAQAHVWHSSVKLPWGSQPSRPRKRVYPPHCPLFCFA